MYIFSSFLPSLLLLNSAASAHLAGTEEFIRSQQAIAEIPASRSSRNDLSSVISESPLLSLHRALVEVPSISGDELAVGKLVVSTLKAHDFIITTQEVPDPDNSTAKRWNIYATPDPKKYSKRSIGSESRVKPSSPKVLLSSHIDTVPPFIPYKLSRTKNSSSRDDVLISGRGTVDDKACVAAQIIATLNLLSSSSTDFHASDIALLFVVSEETNGYGMKHFSNSTLYDSIKDSLSAIIFGEPTEGKLASGHKGISMAHLVARGKAAHSGYPWLGRSANSMIIPALMILDKLGDLLPEEGGLPRSKKYGNSTVNVGYISGGVAANVVPAHAEAKVAFRLAGGTPESVKKTILNAIKGADPKGELEVDIFQGYGPVPLDTDVDGFESIVVNYGTDVPNLEAKDGVKRYLYGPGSILVAHGDDEGLTVGDMEAAVKDYEKLVKHALTL
ncbi:hypothetical protein LTS08_006002 [Lithohypha guttulata]|uniref:uncharacterized protein n=1 Tax=Lithohypha guttulata TaxID=1690604 RepID=UPI002DDF684A|nr:hypothetical protein LTR51_002516 [Lithohypha guttulata]KAK5099420.1 hypothetical protein LTS08_006002 [Lithohypha guttulata]